jgi:tRNA(fMet)-specific endonuclease VapC
MARLHLLDTDIASYVIDRRFPGVDRRLKRLPADSVAISVITRAELMYGLAAIEAQHRLHAGVHMFLATIRCLDWDARAADLYASIRHRLTVAGQKIDELDMMIAAHALAVDAVLVTNNVRHYKRVRPQLNIENWVDA